jgi:hypothetical protein
MMTCDQGLNQVAVDLVNRQDTDFAHVIRIRSEVYGIPVEKCADEIDEYSEIHLARIGGKPVGTLRITRAARGPLDSESYFPFEMICRFRERLASANRFCVLKCEAQGGRVARRLVEAAWRHGLVRGVRIDVIDVNVRGVAYYKRLGYKLLKGEEFVHPLLGTPSLTMAFTTEPWRVTPIAHLFKHVEDPVTSGDIQEWLIEGNLDE